jgi:hypothetical protein
MELEYLKLTRMPCMVVSPVPVCEKQGNVSMKKITGKSVFIP